MRPPSSAAEGSESSMSSITEVPDGEPVAGVLGWDLLKTLPFLLDTPGLQLIWQRQANPPAGATRLPLIEIKGYPCVDLMLGGVCKFRAVVQTSGTGFTLDTGFIKRDAATLWQNARHGHGTESPSPIEADDDALPFDHKLFDEPYSTRWLEIGYGDCKQTLEISPDNDRTPRRATRDSAARRCGALWPCSTGRAERCGSSRRLPRRKSPSLARTARNLRPH